jgi:hypothetical protein
MSSESAPSTHRVVSAADLEALIGEHVTGDGIEEYGVDPHGLFQFATEVEAHDALSDPLFQRFLPAVDWSKIGRRPLSENRRSIRNTARIP